jgi:hypothetical protein
MGKGSSVGVVGRARGMQSHGSWRQTQGVFGTATVSVVRILYLPGAGCESALGRGLGWSAAPWDGDGDEAPDSARGRAGGQLGDATGRGGGWPMVSGMFSVDASLQRGAHGSSAVVSW